MSKLLGYISLGCAKNLVDTEVMLGALQDRKGRHHYYQYLHIYRESKRRID